MSGARPNYRRGGPDLEAPGKSGAPGATPSYGRAVPDAPTLVAFSLAAVALLVVPGPAVLCILTRSVDQGRAAGLVSVAGIHAGTLVHVAGAAAGLSALLVSSAAAYTAVKWAGAAYLVVLGLRRLLAPVPAGEGGERAHRRSGRPSARGWW